MGGRYLQFGVMAKEGSKDEIENVRVVIRVRPLTKKEKAEGCRNIVTIDRQENVINLTKADSNNEKSKTFKFDHIFPEDSSQVSAFSFYPFPL